MFYARGVKRIAIAFALAACSGPVAEPRSTHDTADPHNTHEETSPTPAQEPIAPPPPQPMVEQMIGEVVLGHPRVTPYLHLERNAPLTLWPIPELAQGAPLMRAGGQTVRVVQNESDARFRFRAYEELGGAARVRVRFEIPAEGVTGHVDLELRDYEWTATAAEIVER